MNLGAECRVYQIKKSLLKNYLIQELQNPAIVMSFS